jgi:hypothetical protein
MLKAPTETEKHPGGKKKRAGPRWRAVADGPFVLVIGSGREGRRAGAGRLDQRQEAAQQTCVVDGQHCAAWDLRGLAGGGAVEIAGSLGAGR